MKRFKNIKYIPSIFLMTAVLLFGKPILAFAQEATAAQEADKEPAEENLAAENLADSNFGVDTEVPLLAAIDMEDGKREFYQFDADDNLKVRNSEESGAAQSGQMKKIICILAVVSVVLIITCIFVYRATVVLKRQKRQKRQEGLNRQEREQQEFDFPMDELYAEEELSNDSAVQEEVPASEKAEDTVELPVISVQDVTMVFHISSSNASGIKEYFIQRVKHQVSTRELMALDHINFDVFKGEVVGIIGTNGSGKSTLLRIVSGALSPSGGQVVVDGSKVQLLTLGTGFDMELTARENVYLNGSIIGYSKQFIDEHFDEIVEFAELQQFMDEKVKKFSSGMVSRLGFSIATAGAAAEILILDEVLSVGDEFFRKKSLKKIKEMIHSGSTVLMVSHGMATILDNCSKVVWIEKGKLQMVGEAKVVCQKYREVGNAG